MTRASLLALPTSLAVILIVVIYFFHIQRSPQVARSVRSTALELSHDFGLLAPREVREHYFTVHNRTERPWTLKEVRTSCSCTLARPSSPLIAAGSEGSFHVQYEAPSTPTNDRRSVTILFEESEVPDVIMHVSARVRDTLNPWPRNIVLKASQDTPVVEEALVVETHYVNIGTGSPHVSCPVPWVDVGYLGTRPSVDGGSQSHYRIRVDGSALPAGEHRTELEVRLANQHNLAPIRVRILLAIEPQYLAIPSTLFLLANTTTLASTELLVRSTGDAPAIDSEDVEVVHDLGQAVTTYIDHEGSRLSETKLWVHVDWNIAHTNRIEGHIQVVAKSRNVVYCNVPVLMVRK